MQPYYNDDYVTLYHGDCLDILPQIKDVDLVITSPPYNQKVMPWTPLGNYKEGQSKGGGGKWSAGGRGVVEYDEYDDSMPWPEYERWQGQCLTAMWNTLTPNGAIFYNHKPRLAGERAWFPTAINDSGPALPIRQIVNWIRPGGMNYNPHAFVPTYEWIIIFAKPDWRLKSKPASGIGDCWVMNPAVSDHPAPFPLELPGKAIEATDPVIVLDPFCGSGTTLRAAKNAGVRSVGIEKSERYCEMAVRRLAQEVLPI